MHAVVIETVIAPAPRRLAITIEVFADGRIGDVMLAGHGVQLGDGEFRKQSRSGFEFGGSREVRDVAGVEDQRGSDRHRIHDIDRA